jgi:PAS domain S-box-containing protein
LDTGRKQQQQQQQQQQQKELLRQKQFADNLVNTAQAIILVLNNKGLIVYFNAYMENISGYRLEEVKGKDWFEIFLPEENRIQTRQLFLKAIGNIQTKGNIDWLITKRGLRLQIEWYDNTLKDDKGKVVGLLSIGQDVTERKQAEEELRTAKEGFMAICDNVNLGVSIIDANYRILSVNKHIDRLFNKNLRDFEAKECFRVFENRESVCAHCPGTIVMKGAPTAEIETKGIRDDGSCFNALVRAVPTYGKDGLVSGFVELVEDIAERKKTEQTLQESERRLKEAQQVAHVGNWEWDLESGELFWSDENYRMFGIPPGTKPSQEVYEKAIHPEDLALLNKNIEDTLARNLPYDFHFRIILPSGEVRVIYVIGKVERDSTGKPLRFYGTVQDITERKKAEDKIKMFSDAVNSASECFVLIDMNGDFIYANQSSCATFGYTPEEFMKIDIAKLDTDPQTIRKIQQEVMAKGKWSGEVSNIKKNGEKFQSFLSVFIVVGSQGAPTGMMGILKDITELKKAQQALIDAASAKAAAGGDKKRIVEIEKAYEELRALKDMFVQSEKLASLGEFSAGIAHELNNPLTGILSIARYQLEHKNPGNREYDDLKEIAEAGQRMARIIRGVLDFSMPSRGEVEELNFNDIIESMLGLSKSLMISKNIAVLKSYQKDLPLVRGDRIQFLQIVINIIDNAIDAMQNNGRLEISTRAISVDQSRFVEIEFEDNGCGISREDIKKIFNPFFTTKRPDKGVGLGLSVVYSIVKEHKGNILVESPAAGKENGTVFKVRIPAINKT